MSIFIYSNAEALQPVLNNSYSQNVHLQRIHISTEIELIHANRSRNDFKMQEYDPAGLTPVNSEVNNYSNICNHVLF